MLDPSALRQHFPSLTRQQEGRPVLYFDNPAGTQVPRETIDGFVRYLEQSNANVGGAFVTSERTGQVVADTRRAMADFLGAASPDEIVLGPNMTTLTFAVAHALGDVLRPGDEIVTTRLEHDANVAPWLALQDRGIIVRWIDIHPEDCTLDLESAAQVIGEKTRVIAVGYASNAVGTINDVRKIAQMAHAVGAWVYVDAVHYGPHGSIDVQALDVDLLVCSSYKFFGPHLGILYGRREVLETLPAYHVRPAGDVPQGKWEKGTGSFESWSGLLGTIDYLCSLAGPDVSGRQAQLRDAFARIHTYERTLTNRLLAGMTALPGVRVFGITDPAAFEHRVPTISFVIAGVEPRTIAEELGKQGIFSWAGNHYALEPLGRLGLSATNRIGLVHYNTHAEIDRFLDTLERVSTPYVSRSAVESLLNS
ncbi:MAG: cysteine desulfurase-like protein [Chloroflexota bacterium]